MKEKIEINMQKWKNVKEWPLKQKIITAVVLCLCCGGVFAAILAGRSRKAPVYREVQVAHGSLMVGVTETGSISIGTSEQTLGLDISEYTGGSGISAGGPDGMGRNEGMGSMMQVLSGMGAVMQGGNASSAGSEGTRTLQVEEVYVSAGQEIGKGQPLLKLTEESVKGIREKLQEDASSAQLTYEQQAANQKLVEQQARIQKNINQAYGEYAEAEYEKTVSTLKTSVETYQTQLEEEQILLEETKQLLGESESTLAEYQEVLKNAEYARDTTDREENLFGWINAMNAVYDSREIIEALEEEIAAAKEEIRSLEDSIASISLSLSLAARDLRTGEVDAEAQKAQRLYQYENAQEIYEVTIGQSSYDAETAREEYEEADSKLEEFDRVIVDGVITSEYSGMITEMTIHAGDTLEQDTVLAALSDYEEVTVTVSVEEGDMESASVGKEVRIFLNAFPDQIFQGEVTEVGDAEINSNTNTAVYSVTVSVTEEAKGLYEGMTAEVTFVTEEAREVLYVPNRALSEGSVLIKDDKGKHVKKQVSTGFTDGVYTEIKEGLSEGDIVLIEAGN